MPKLSGHPTGVRSHGGVAALYRRYGPVVYRRCLRILGSREAAEDITQEVFVKLVQELPRLAGRESVLPWVYRVATNASLNLQRTRRHRGEDAALRALALAGLVAKGGCEDRVLVFQLLDRLDETTRAVALQVVVGGLEHAEVAERLQLSPRAVARRLERFREHSRRVLAEG